MISVAMITMNEEEAVGSVVRSIAAVAPGAEILIVDSSEDRTCEIAEELGAKVVRQYPPQGYGSAMELALHSARGEVVVTMDCDNTYPEVVIPALAGYILEDGYDLVDCSRLRQKPAAMRWVNFLANRGFAMLASLLFCRRFSDLHSGMRAYRKTMLDGLTLWRTEGAALPVELLLRPVRLGWKVKTVYIDYRERIGKSTMKPLSSAWWTLLRILKVRFGGIERVAS